MREEWSRVVAALARSVGIGAAEDAAADAVEAAIRHWPAEGVPPQPRAWLTLVARRRALDALRREARRPGKEREGAALVDLTAAVRDGGGDDEDTVRDDVLRLVFTCCHPALSRDAQVALTLRVVCGLPVEDVAAALLVPEPTLRKRLTRAKHKIAAAAIPYRVPAAAELPARLAPVCSVVHLVYTCGHSPPTGTAPLRLDLCVEAVRLARLLLDLMPDEAGVMGLLALLLLVQARAGGRLDAEGEPVPLREADRRLWDGAALAEGRGLLERSLRRTGGMADAYQLQAAVALCHTAAPSWEATDWREVARLYGVLEEVAPGPAVRLNRAVAVAEVDGPRAGLDLLAADPAASALPMAAGVRAELLDRIGERAAAAAEVRDTLEGAPAPGYERWLRRRLDELAAVEG